MRARHSPRVDGSRTRFVTGMQTIDECPWRRTLKTSRTCSHFGRCIDCHKSRRSDLRLKDCVEVSY